MLCMRSSSVQASSRSCWRKTLSSALACQRVRERACVCSREGEQSRGNREREREREWEERERGERKREREKERKREREKERKREKEKDKETFSTRTWEEPRRWDAVATERRSSSSCCLASCLFCLFCPRHGFTSLQEGLDLPPCLEAASACACVYTSTHAVYTYTWT